MAAALEAAVETPQATEAADLADVMKKRGGRDSGSSLLGLENIERGGY